MRFMTIALGIAVLYAGACRVGTARGTPQPAPALATAGKTAPPAPCAASGPCDHPLPVRIVIVTLLRENEGYAGLNAAVENLYRVGSRVVDELSAHRDRYEKTIPQ